jgi:hypothetical protein
MLICRANNLDALAGVFPHAIASEPTSPPDVQVAVEIDGLGFWGDTVGKGSKGTNHCAKWC